MKLALALLDRPLVEGNAWWHWTLIFIGIVIGGGCLIFAIKTAVANYVSTEWQPKAMALVYIVVALFLAALVFHVTGVF